MTKYDKLKKKYDNLIRHSLEKNKRILIESFVEYYGEEFRYLIEKRYNEITFIYYIDWNMIDMVINEFLPKIDNTDKYVDFINFSNSRKKTLLSELLKKGQRPIKLPDNLIGMTDTSIINDDAIVNWLFKALSRSVPCSRNYGSINHMNRLIVFQILALNERAIIHEINHAITRDNIAYIMKGNAPIGAISKTGLSIDVSHQNNGERKIEELLNEKTSEEIEKIFKSKGGNLSTFCLDIPLEYVYEYNFYLIDDFYTQFKKYIKIARISENKNELISRIGQKEYEEFIRLVNSFYVEEISQIEPHKEKVIPIIKQLVEKMSEHADNSHTHSRNEINKYLEQLKKSGYNLRMIDTLQNNAEDLNYDSDLKTQRR